jgi:S-(hydroxymethyl)glutathione dehydrogenase/alcohol dehydrogenase
MGVINNDARVGIGESIVVFGAGGVGLNVVQFAAMAGAHPIVAIDLHDHKLELARKLGATHTINATKGDVEAGIRAAVGEADVAIENTGLADVIEMAYRVTGPKGRVILVGVPNKGARHPTLYTLPLHFEKVLKGSEGGSCKPDVDIPKLVRLCAAGRLGFDELVTRRYPLAEINAAIGDFRAGRVAGRCIIVMSSP